MTDESTRNLVLETTRELVSRASENPPGEEQAVAEWIRDRLFASPVPFEVSVDVVESGRSNVVARVGDPGRGTVLLAGHTDVVPASSSDWTSDPFDPSLRGQRLYGRGAADMKGALAAMIVATEQYIETTRDPGEVVLGFVVDEEQGGAGARALVADGIEADLAVIGEPTELDVCTAVKGVSRYEVTIHGESCHSGRPDSGQNAVQGLPSLLERVAELDRELESTEHPVLDHEDVTVTCVESEDTPNVVSDWVKATVDWRFLPGQLDPASFDDRIRAALSDLSLGEAHLDVTVRRTMFARGAEVDLDHQLVAAITEAAEECGIETGVSGLNGATDARFLIHDASIPTVHFGPGSLTDDAHTVDESVAVDDLVAATTVYRTALSRLLG
jgi:acetylornithine deacetylase/succinyl-diaminopimelate desuccinylase family protein